VWIEVDGKELPEFDVEVDEVAKKTTCWIPSEAGKVLYRFPRRHICHACL